MYVADLLTRRAELTPNREALVEVAAGKRYTFAQLNQRANQAAHFLRQRGVQQGDRVCLLAHNSVAYVDLLYGLAKIGAILVPLNWRLATAEFLYILHDSQPVALVYGPEFAAAVAEMRPQLSIPHYIGLEGAWLEGSIFYEEALQTAETTEPERPFLIPEDPVCITYTSGTTGRPKGAILPHRQIFWNCINTVVSWGITAEDTAPILTPMFHAGGLFVFLTPLFYVGGRVVMARTFETADSLHLIQQENCTVVLGVPTLFQLWLTSPALPPVNFGRIRWFISGGAPCPPKLIHEWRQTTGCILRQGYGLTEVGPNCFSMTDDESIQKVGSVGKPIFHSQMQIVDENGRILPPHHTGELLIYGPHVCTGYWNNPQATQNALRGGWFHTGDMAYQDEDGFFYIVGRFKDMIISGGENIYAAEVEAVFLEHSAVAQAALIGQPDEKWGEVGVMVVVLAEGQTTSESALRDFCRARLAGYKMPKQIIFADALPFSPYGKVEKNKLKEKYSSLGTQKVDNQ